MKRFPVHKPPSPSQAEGRTRSDRAYDRGRRRADAALAAAKRLRSSVAWRTFRAWFLGEHPLCANPLRAHLNIRAAEQVHHLRPLADAPELAFDADNCLAVCTLCHGLLSARERGDVRREK